MTEEGEEEEVYGSRQLLQNKGNLLMSVLRPPSVVRGHSPAFANTKMALVNLTDVKHMTVRAAAVTRLAIPQTGH